MNSHRQPETSDRTSSARRLAIAIVLMGIVLAVAPRPASASPAIELSMHPGVIDLEAGDEAVVALELPAAGKLWLVLYDSAHRRVRTLVDGRDVPSGAFSARWKGETDGGGRAGAGQAYYPLARLRTVGGEVLDWDRAAETAGVPVKLPAESCRHDREAGGVRIAIPRPCRVQLRAGVHGGPLLANLLEWAPLPAGESFVKWDGRDTSGVVDVAGHEGFSLAARAYSLPEGSVIVAGTPSESTGLPAAKAELLPADRAPQMLGKMLGSGPAKAPESLRAKAIEVPPEFDVIFRDARSSLDGIPIVGAVARIGVEIPTESESRLQGERFEIVIYVDFERVAEEEQGYAPYTCSLATKRFGDGEHMLSVTVASLAGRMSTVSRPFIVKGEEP